MVEQQVRPLLQSQFGGDDILVSRVLRFYGIGESQLVTKIADLIDGQSNPTLATYIKDSEVTLRLTAKSPTETAASQLIDDMADEVLLRLSPWYYGLGEHNSLAAVVVAKLKDQQQTISAAESLTAGLFQSTLGDIAGVSAVFPGGFVTYANQTKESQLDIDPQIIAENGVVSEATAIAMAVQTQTKLHTDFAVSFTGVAGPDALEDQPVGPVWIGLVTPGKAVFAKRYHFSGDRNKIRQQAVLSGLALVNQSLKN